jgi:hypothetical protein
MTPCSLVPGRQGSLTSCRLQYRGQQSGAYSRLVTLKVKAVRDFETSGSTQASTQRRIPEQRPCQNLKPHNQLFCLTVGKGKTTRLDFVWAEKRRMKGGGVTK